MPAEQEESEQQQEKELEEHDQNSGKIHKRNLMEKKPGTDPNMRIVTRLRRAHNIEICRKV